MTHTFKTRTKRLATLLLTPLFLSACTDTSPNVILETELGAIEIEVYPNVAPLSAADFLYYVDEGLYNGQSFYRSVTPQNDPRQMGMSLIQGGRADLLPVTQGIEHETKTGISNVSGTVSIARDAPGTGSAAFFFINIGDNTFLDYGGERNPDGQGYASFGTVVKGMDVVRSIQTQAVGIGDVQNNPVTAGQFLTDPVVITKAYRK